MTDKPAKPVKLVRRRTRVARPKPVAVSTQRELSHAEISERAYFIALEQGSADELGTWLRAERELAAA
jgi:hypothetical protein